MKASVRDALSVVFIWLCIVAAAGAVVTYPVILKWIIIYVVFVATPTLVLFNSIKYISPKEGQ